MNPKYKQLLHFAMIFIGGGAILVEQSKEKDQNIYILIAGLVVLMYGLYKATTKWVSDNPRPEKDDFVVTEELDEVLEDEEDWNRR